MAGERHQPLASIEVGRNGDVVRTIATQNERTEAGAYRTALVGSIPARETSWIALRCFESRPNGRFRFAHTAPWHIQHGAEVISPKRAEIDWLVARVTAEIERGERLLSPAGRAEYRQALEAYEAIALPGAIAEVTNQRFASRRPHWLLARLRSGYHHVNILTAQLLQHGLRRLRVGDDDVDDAEPRSVQKANSYQ